MVEKMMKVKVSENKLPTIQEMINGKLQAEKTLSYYQANGKVVTAQSDESLTLVKNLELLSSLYIENFQESVPIEKLTDIYNINKKYKAVIKDNENFKN
jgi:hypothetical protein